MKCADCGIWMDKCPQCGAVGEAVGVHICERCPPFRIHLDRDPELRSWYEREMNTTHPNHDVLYLLRRALNAERGLGEESPRTGFDRNAAREKLGSACTINAGVAGAIARLMEQVPLFPVGDSLREFHAGRGCAVYLVRLERAYRLAEELRAALMAAREEL